MKRFLLPGLLAATAIAASGRCASNTIETVSITREPSAVATCRRVGEVTVDAKTPDSRIHAELAAAAKAQGANTVFIPAEGSRTGTAHFCETKRLSHS
ncbi:MAG: hypothetical protein ABI592_12840 [Acidobacteriota bacterium]